MNRDLVEDRAWVSRQDYAEGLAFSQLSPGPLAAQLAMYLGWVRAGRWQLSWMQGMFYGIGAAVIAIIAQSAFRLTAKWRVAGLLFSLITSIALICVAQESPATRLAKRRVVFVCEHGSAKSVIAAAHFNRLAAERGLPYEAVSRGVQPDENIPPAVVSGLAADGLDVGKWKPTAITGDDVRGASRVVTFACKLPASAPPVANRLLQWDDPVPPISQSYESARKLIVDRVDALVEDLAARTKAQGKR